MKEPPGHARGIRVNVPHKRAFSLSKEERLNMKNARSDCKRRELCEKIKRDMYPGIRKEVEESYMQQKTLMMRDSHETEGDVDTDDATYCMATPYRSSCASADPTTMMLQLDMIGLYLTYMDTGRLKAVLTHYEGTLECAIV
ncbi:hypothetical protein D1007_39254 [Hordeum vulgare]|nr:hypothetical protein D1007_39254 [Hordeum vulgare]